MRTAQWLLLLAFLEQTQKRRCFPLISQFFDCKQLVLCGNKNTCRHLFKLIFVHHLLFSVLIWIAKSLSFFEYMDGLFSRESPFNFRLQQKLRETNKQTKKRTNLKFGERCWLWKINNFSWGKPFNLSSIWFFRKMTTRKGRKTFVVVVFRAGTQTKFKLKKRNFDLMEIRCCSKRKKGKNTFFRF